MKPMYSLGCANLSALWLAMRASNAFLLGVLDQGTGGCDYVDTVLLISIVQANVAPIVQQPELHARYATIEAVPPDELRRPISISALSASLGMSFETVRRRLLRLQRDGRCKIDPDGVRVPVEVVRRHDNSLLINYQLVKVLNAQLRAAGQLQDLPRSEAEPNADGPPLRAVARLSYDFFLRTLDLLAVDSGSLLTALAWITVLHNNVCRLPEFDSGAMTDGETGWSGDHRRQPVPVSSVATQLGVSEATIRRRILQAIRTGRCCRVPGGVIVPDSALHRPSFVELMRKNEANLGRMFHALHRVGALRGWDAA